MKASEQTRFPGSNVLTGSDSVTDLYSKVPGDSAATAQVSQFPPKRCWRRWWRYHWYAMLGAAREVTPSIQPSIPDMDQLKVVPNRAWSRHLCKLPQPCHRQTQPRMDALRGKKNKYSTLFYCLAWAAQWGSAHAAAACTWSVGSLVSSVLQKDTVPTWVTAIKEDFAKAGVVRWEHPGPPPCSFAVLPSVSSASFFLCFSSVHFHFSSKHVIPAFLFILFSIFDPSLVSQPFCLLLNFLLNIYYHDVK